jgi:flagellar basal-body rod protein FlgC
MGWFETFEMSAAGMDVQQLRLQVAATNLANARTSSETGEPYRPLEVIVHNATRSGAAPGALPISTRDALPAPVAGAIVETDVAPRLVYDPGHPHADERGMVSLPGVDPVSSMLDLVDISRNYEANLRAFDVTRSLLMRTLEMGSKR